MKLRTLFSLGAVLTIASAAVAADRYPVPGCETGSSTGWVIGSYAISASTGSVAEYREQKRGSVDSADRRRALVVADLPSGRVEFEQEVGYWTNPQITISDRDKYVACSHGGTSSGDLSRLTIWEPGSGADTLTTFDYVNLRALNLGNGDFRISNDARPAISLDENVVAIFGSVDRGAGNPGASGANEVAGVLEVDLATRKPIRVTELPSFVSTTKTREWLMFWDGDTLYSVVNSSDRRMVEVRPRVRAREAGEPRTVLRRGSGAKTFTVLGQVDGECVGFDGRGNLLLRSPRLRGVSRVSLGELNMASPAIPSQVAYPQKDVAAVTFGNGKRYTVLSSAATHGCPAVEVSSVGEAETK